MTITALAGRALDLDYGRAPVVRSADIELERGRVTALVGPNGSGKSTLLRALARLHRPSSGHITLDQDDATALGAKDFARRLTLLSQSRSVPSGITVTEAVEFGRHPHRGRWRAHDPDGPAAVARALELTGLTSQAETALAELSGGQVQRAWLASCLAQRTDVLLLDEPTNHLDLRYQVEVLHLIHALTVGQGVTIGVVLHDLDQAAAIADHVLLLAEGSVVAHGTPHEVFTSSRLSEVYGLPIDVFHDSTGRVRIHVPLALGAAHVA